nr:hypothetical protein GCM10020093_084520 [Planobispora longispora]
MAGGPALELSAWWPVGATVLGAALTVLTGVELPGRTLGWRLVSWVMGGSWLTWSLLTDLSAPTPWLVLGGITLASGMTYSWADAPRRRLARGGHRPGLLGNVALPVIDIPRRDVPLAQEWVARIARVCKIRVQATQLEHWPSGGGFSLLLRLPQGGTTTEQLAGYAPGWLPMPTWTTGAGWRSAARARADRCGWMWPPSTSWPPTSTTTATTARATSTTGSPWAVFATGRR